MRKTTHPKKPAYETDILAWIHSIQEFSRKTTFQRLEILNFHEERDRATVTFTAHLTQERHPTTLTEKSTFVKEHHHWWYLSGEMIS